MIRCLRHEQTINICRVILHPGGVFTPVMPWEHSWLKSPKTSDKWPWGAEPHSQKYALMEIRSTELVFGGADCWTGKWRDQTPNTVGKKEAKMLPAAVFSLSSSDTFPPCKQCIRKVDTKSKYNLTFAKKRLASFYSFEVDWAFVDKVFTCSMGNGDTFCFIFWHGNSHDWSAVSSPRVVNVKSNKMPSEICLKFKYISHLSILCLSCLNICD